MTTRFYLSRDNNVRSAPCAPAFGSSWSGGTTTRALLARTTSATSGGSVSSGTETSGTAVDLRVTQWISHEIPTARTIDGTFRAVIPVVVDSVAANTRLRARVAVVSSDGLIVRGECLWAMGGTDVPVGNISSGYAPRTVEGNLTAVNAQAGDRVIVELGVYFGNTDTANHTAYLYTGDSAASTDLPYADGPASTARGWAEFSSDFLAPAATPGNALALVNHVGTNVEQILSNIGTERPEGTQVGDLLVLAIRTRQVTSLPTFPNGFALAADSGPIGSSTSAVRTTIATKVATASDINSALPFNATGGYVEFNLLAFRNARVAGGSGASATVTSPLTGYVPLDHPHPAITNTLGDLTNAVAVLANNCLQAPTIPAWLNADGTTPATIVGPRDSASPRFVNRIITGINLAAGGTYTPPTVRHATTGSQTHNYNSAGLLLSVSPPATPTNVIATATGEHTGTVTWDSVSNATSYEMRVNGGAPFATTSPATLTGLGAGADYNVELRAIGDGGTSSWTAPVTLATFPPPDVPYTITVTATGEHTGTVTWDSVPRATGYEVRVNGGAPIPATSPLELTDLTTATAYTVEVRSLGDGTYSAWSGPRTLTTFAPNPFVAPPVSDPTRRVYDALPELYRTADAAVGGFPLLRYLALLLDQLGPVDDLIARNAGDTLDGDVDLVDPARADAGWLRWLAQLLGVTVDGLTIAEQRTALATPEDAWAHGTPAAIAAAAADGLTGTKAVNVTPHYGGDPFTIGIGTLDAETTTADTFAELKAVAPRWADLAALGSFANAKAPAPIRAAEPERPAGYRLARHTTG